MKAKRKNIRPVVLGAPLAIIVIALVVFIVIRMEGETPGLLLEMASPSIGADGTVTVRVGDEKSGLRHVWAAIMKDGKETVLLDKTYPSDGLFTGGRTHADTVVAAVNAQANAIEDGKAVLRLAARDFSWRKWGRGNQHYQEHPIIIDTKAPLVQVLSHAHNLNQGGAGLVLYKLSEECPISGVMVGDDFYPGMAGVKGDAGLYAAFIALDFSQGSKTSLYVTATDFAGNQGRGGLSHHINNRRFRRDNITISDQFLNSAMPAFQSQVAVSRQGSLLDVFLKVNQDLRKNNYDVLLQSIKGKSRGQMLWDGAFLRLPGAANRAGFADHRSYFYKDKKIDEQTHMGIDLASVDQAPVPAANSGFVLFADSLGIYGGTIVIDHGFGLSSMYSHLSHIGVAVGQSVARGDIIGRTGRTGLAAGDHLHFSMLVHHTFVNPLEWWDAQWIQHNVSAKLEALP